MEWLRAFNLGAVALIATSAAVSAQSSDDRADLAIPRGGTPIAQVLGLDPATAGAARIVVESARLVYSVPEGQSDNARMLAAVKQYFDALDALDAAKGRVWFDVNAASGKPASPLLAALGLAVEGTPPRVGLTAGPAAQVHRETLERAGIEIQPIADALNRGEPATINTDAHPVPLPLGADAWRRLLPRRIADRPLYRTIFEDRQAGLLYAGLAALDPETLAWVGASKTAARDLYDRAAVFAASSRTLHIRGGAVMPPGGADASALWESVIGAPLADPGAFIRRLYGGEGRLAYLYDTIGALDDPHQRYALGLWFRNALDRLARLRKLAELFVTFDESWRIRQTPFSHPPTDPALTLLGVRVNSDGTPLSPASREFWSAIFAEPPSDPSRGYDIRADDPADAAWLLERALETPVAARRPRVERMLFVTRLAERGVNDVDALIRAAHGFARFPALMLILERLPLTDASLYGEAARQAAALGTIDRAHATTVTALLQGAIAIIDRARFARTISPDRATALVRSLVALNVSEAGYDGAVSTWIDNALLPALSDGVPAGSDADAVLVRAVAGHSPATPVAVTWEDQIYHVDVAAAEIARLERLRRDQHVTSIATVLAFARAVMRTGTNDAAASDEVRTALSNITLDRDPPAFAGVRQMLADTEDAFRGRRVHGSDRPRLVRLADRLLAYSMLTLVYAISLGDADADPTTIFDPQLGDRHDFSRTPAGAWAIPHEESGSGQPWHLQGSLLGLDIGLARFAFRRLSTEPPMQAPRVSSNDRQTFAESIALMNPHELQDADQAEIASAIARGRERVARLADAPQDADARIDEIDAVAHLGAWQREAIRWTLDRDPAATPALFSLADLFWLGAPAASLLDRIDAWGLSARPLDGSVMSRFPRPCEWETFTGRPSIGLLATRTPEMMLRVATALAELKLPVVLARGVAAAATLDLVDDAPLGHRDDRRAVAHYPETVPLTRIQDYVSLLTAGGPLIPAANRRGGPPPR